MVKISRPEAFQLQHAARMLDVSVSTMRRWIRDGRLRAFKAGPKLWFVELSELRRIKKLQAN